MANPAPDELEQRDALPVHLQASRQIAVDRIGSQGPILLLTNRCETAVADLVDHCARRVLIENAAEERSTAPTSTRCPRAYR